MKNLPTNGVFTFRHKRTYPARNTANEISGIVINCQQRKCSSQWVSGIFDPSLTIAIHLNRIKRPLPCDQFIFTCCLVQNRMALRKLLRETNLPSKALFYFPQENMTGIGPTKIILEKDEAAVGGMVTVNCQGERVEAKIIALSGKYKLGTVSCVTQLQCLPFYQRSWLTMLLFFSGCR